MHTLKYGTTSINYILYTQNRRDLKISITLVNGVEVYAPESLHETKLHELLLNKAPWITGKIKELNQVEIRTQKKNSSAEKNFPISVVIIV